MSLLTQVDSMPSRVRGLFRYLLAQPSQRSPRDELVKTLAPRSLATLEEGASSDSKSRRAVTTSITESIECGLLVEDGEFIAVNPKLLPQERNLDSGDRNLPETIIRLALAQPPEVSGNNDDFGLALAWLLAQNPYDPPGTWKKAEDLLHTQFGADMLGLQQSNPFANLRYWSVFLGFTRCEATGKGEVTLVPDPTEALRRSLSRLLQSGQRKLLSEITTSLAEAVPVFDGGRFRLLLEHRCNSLAPPRGSLSESLSLGFLRLRDEGFLKLEYRADAPSQILQSMGVQYQFSHITRSQTASVQEVAL